jgi:pimeloyl-ACP methyl ester carboxylesterase
MILLHGALGAAAQLADLSSHFAAGTSHTFDFAGHGAHAPPDGHFGIAGLAEQLEQYVDGHGLRGSPCFGYSMGGYVALFVAATRPGLLGPVTTFATKLAWTPESAAKEATQLDPEAIRLKVPSSHSVGVEAWVSGWQPLCVATAGMMRDLGAHPVLDTAALGRISAP